MVARQDFQGIAHRIWKLFRHEPRADSPFAVVEVMSTLEIKLSHRLSSFAFVVRFQHRHPNDHHVGSFNDLRKLLRFVLQSLRTINTAATRGREKSQHTRLGGVSVELLFECLD